MDRRAQSLMKVPKLFTISLAYDKTKNDVEEIKRLRKIVREASSIVRKQITNPSKGDDISGRMVFVFNN